MNAVHLAISTKDLQIIDEITVGGKNFQEIINQRDNKNRTTLQLLLDMKINEINLVSKFLSSGGLPCQLFVQTSEEERTEEPDYLYVGEDFNDKNLVALFYEWGVNSPYATLYRYIQSDQSEKIGKIIDEYQLDVNATKFWGNYTPLYIATRDSKYNSVKQL